VGELPLSVQAKLLRTLQNGEIQRLGADKPLHVDVRIIAATNRHLPDSIRDGLFRADLYHRLSVYPVPIPPLRERGHDVLMLAGHFLELNRTRLGLRGLRLSPAAEQALLAYHWPGNVRELEHVISRAALKELSRGASRGVIMTLEPQVLDLDVSTNAAAVDMPAQSIDAPLRPLSVTVDECQRQAILRALERCGQNWAGAARLLEIDPSNLHKLARRLGLK
jgi:anaerobic nitric oxide reductase transcription regulator